MKVNNNSNPALGQIQKQQTDKLTSNLGKDVADSNKVSQSAINDSASVKLSEKAQEMQKAKDIASDSSIDEAKVARLQKMIDAGDYKIDAEAIADRMVDEHIIMS